MKIYLDTADLSEIEAGAGWGFIDGLTTNPTLLAKQGHSDLETTVKEICGMIEGPVSVEVTTLDTEGMLEQGRTYAPWADNVVVKVPLIPEGLAAVRQFSDEGIATNVTLCFSANQALFAARAGATYISPFLGRLDDISQDGMELIRDIAEIYAIHDLPTEIIAASIRHPVHILEAAKAGAHIATCPFAVVKQSMKHPLTDAGLEKFMADWRALQGIPDTVGAV